MTGAELDKKWENTVWDTDVYLDDLDGKEPITNEEWFCELSTEEKARFFASNKMLNYDYQMWIEWLREIRK